MTELLLNVADIRLKSRVNGPGVRSVVWVQGCTIGCPGCFNPHTHPHEGRRLIDPKRLGWKLAEEPDIDGVTISGGEPFEQSVACSILAAAVRKRGLSIMVFSGYSLAQLQQSSDLAVSQFLAEIDVLVAGPYIRSKSLIGHSWRASANQTVHRLTDRIRTAVNTPSDSQPVVEVTTNGKAMSCTGFPAKIDQQWLARLAASSERCLARTGNGPSADVPRL